MAHNQNSSFFVLCQFSSGREWIARDPGAMDFQSTVDDIASGEISGMIEVRQSDNWADVTREVALAVSMKWADGGEALTYEQYEFVELALGTRAARSFLRAA